MRTKSALPQLYINGRFLEQPPSGVQRYAREMVQALDALLAAEKTPAEDWCLLTTGRGTEHLNLRRISIRPLPSPLGGHAWEQSVLGWAARDGVLIGFGGSGPLAHPRQLVVIHDASVFRNPDFFSRRYGTWHRWIGRALARRARIGTVSHFSQRELAETLGLDAKSIPVFNNGADHMLRATGAIDAPTGLETRPYFVVVGNLTRNKNIAVAIEALDHVPDCRLVIVGGSVGGVFATSDSGRSDERLIFAGRLSDGEISALLKDASALLFPSLYEGFGIPPLEAMVVGCPVIASDIPAVREACGDAAVYFDPTDAVALAERMQSVLRQDSEQRADRISRGKARAANFTWQGSAMELLAFCRSQLLPGGTPE